MWRVIAKIDKNGNYYIPERTQAFAADWAASAKENDNIWLFADIFGISDLSDIDSIMVTPTVIVNGLNNEITNGSQTYLINA